jgi:hypothetical protein
MQKEPKDMPQSSDVQFKIELYQDQLKTAGALLRQYGKCTSCRGATYFDHGSGEGTIAECIPDDPGKHRYCPCRSCNGTGLASNIQTFFARTRLLTEMDL